METERLELLDLGYLNRMKSGTQQLKVP